MSVKKDRDKKGKESSLNPLFVAEMLWAGLRLQYFCFLCCCYDVDVDWEKL